MILSVKAAVFAAMNKIETPWRWDSLSITIPFPDATPKFYKKWGDALGKRISDSPLRVIAPYRQLFSKA